MNVRGCSPGIGELVMAKRVITSGPGPRRAHSIIVFLTACIALMMTGFGIATPIFARRLGELGSGVEILSLMTTASALAQFLLAPLMGALADRFGRRPFVLLALAGLALTNLAFLRAQSTDVYIAIRFLQGAVSVGLLPAAMGMLADLVPEQQRSRWVGVIMSGYAVGFTFGPVIGGLLFEHWGFVAPFGVSALLDLLALLVACVMVPETRPASIRRVQQRYKGQTPTRQHRSVASLPRPLSFFAALLLLDFLAVFGMEFIEPQMVFYLYNTLSLTTAQYGLMMGGYGLAALIGQMALGHLGDRFGRKPMIALGFLLNATLSLGLIVLHQFSILALAALIAGVGSAFITPGLGASYLDIIMPQHRSRILGIRESAISLGAVVGPLLVALISRWLAPQGIFTVALLTTLAAVILALVVLKPPGQTNVHAPGEPVVGTRVQIAAVISTMRTMVEAAQTSRVNAKADDVSFALRRATSPLEGGLVP